MYVERFASQLQHYPALRRGALTRTYPLQVGVEGADKREVGRAAQGARGCFVGTDKQREGGHPSCIKTEKKQKEIFC